jgi:hypothetical protein
LVFRLEPLFLGLDGDLPGDSRVRIARDLVTNNNKSVVRRKKKC